MMSVLNLTPEPEQNKLVDDKQLIVNAKSGANWFYWIAGLSIVNSLIATFGGNWSFFAGLGITQIIDGFLDQLTGSGTFSIGRVIGLGINLFIAAAFLLCGLWANKLQTAASLIGMVLYFLDGLLVLLLGAYLPALFHAFALFMIFRGFLAARQVKVQG